MAAKITHPIKLAHLLAEVAVVAGVVQCCPLPLAMAAFLHVLGGSDDEGAKDMEWVPPPPPTPGFDRTPTTLTPSPSTLSSRMRSLGTELQEDSQESEGPAMSLRVKRETLAALTPPRRPNHSSDALCKEEDNTGEKATVAASKVMNQDKHGEDLKGPEEDKAHVSQTSKVSQMSSQKEEGKEAEMEGHLPGTHEEEQDDDRLSIGSLDAPTQEMPGAKNAETRNPDAEQMSEDEEEPDERQVKEQEEEEEEEEEKKLRRRKMTWVPASVRQRNARGARWTIQRQRSYARHLEVLALSMGVAHRKTL